VEVIAAIDLIGGRSVRLRRGDYGQRVESALRPTQLATRWAAAGASRLHVVDLEGARSGQPRQREDLALIVSAAREANAAIRVQTGGGLRTEADVEAAFDAGADAAVLGTAALEVTGFVARCAARWPGAIVASLDVRDGRPVADGWLREIDTRPVEVARRLLDEGATELVITDTGRDGMLAGPNLHLLTDLREAFPDARFVAAGGVRSIDDLLALRRAGLDGAIVGMALLTGSLDLAQAVATLAMERAPA
jgi:phosphoribosylformimino-5-aminoimidazole carboxamide ribotide isomerase